MRARNAVGSIDVHLVRSLGPPLQPGIVLYNALLCDLPSAVREEHPNHTCGHWSGAGVEIRSGVVLRPPALKAAMWYMVQKKPYAAGGSAFEPS